jgi:tetraacyldisaccharide 4'-kinase
VAGVARADVVVITRSDMTDLGPAVERVVRRHNPSAPIVRATVVPQVWVENRTGREHPLRELDFTTAGAFCGLGNPEGFRRTLERQGVGLVDWIEFSDHHRYRPEELRRMVEHLRARGATVVLTTGKDAVNLPEDADDLLAPLTLYWLKVVMRFDDEAALMGVVERRLWRR